MIYTEDDIRVLMKMTKDIGIENKLRIVFYETGGTLQDETFFPGSDTREFLDAKFEDVPKYIGANFSTLVKWRLTIGR